MFLNHLYYLKINKIVSYILLLFILSLKKIKILSYILLLFILSY
jgi:hypothetical protein